MTSWACYDIAHGIKIYTATVDDDPYLRIVDIGGDEVLIPLDQVKTLIDGLATAAADLAGALAGDDDLDDVPGLNGDELIEYTDDGTPFFVSRFNLAGDDQ